jgi:hypothetical protein
VSSHSSSEVVAAAAPCNITINIPMIKINNQFVHRSVRKVIGTSLARINLVFLIFYAMESKRMIG